MAENSKIEWRRVEDGNPDRDGFYLVAIRSQEGFPLRCAISEWSRCWHIDEYISHWAEVIHPDSSLQIRQFPAAK